FCQAEDGIRDDLVTGVQTCALPIYLVEDDEVDVDGGVVLGDGGLLGNHQVLLPEVDPDRPVDARKDEDEARPPQAGHPAQAEQHDPLVLPDHLDGRRQDEVHHQGQDGGDDQDVHAFPPSLQTLWSPIDGTDSGKTSSFNPFTARTSTCAPAGTGPPTDSADHDSPRTCTR